MANSGGKGDTFVMRRSFLDAIDNLDDAKFRKMIHALADYGFEQKPPQLEPELNAVFSLMKPAIDSSFNRHKAATENGKKGGRPPKKAKPVAKPVPKVEPKPVVNRKPTKEKPMFCECGGTLRESRDGKLICLSCLKEY